MSKEAYLVVFPVDPLRVGEHYTLLPLHCTLMPWFNLKYCDLEKLKETLADIASKLSPESIVLTADTRDWFGELLNIPVYRLVRDERICTLHTTLLVTLSSMHCEPADFTYVGVSYQPHVSDAGERVFSTGMTHVPEQFVLIHRDPLGVRTVVAEFPFGM